MASMPLSTSLAAERSVTSLGTPIFSAFKSLETAARPTPSRRAASAGLFPSRVNCKSVSSLAFFFAMDTSWKHHGNFWFTAVSPVEHQNELSTVRREARRGIRKIAVERNKHFPLDDAGRETRSRNLAGMRGRRAKAEEGGLPSHLASVHPETP